jgi:xylan 1,4-beta-xylosidase
MTVIIGVDPHKQSHTAVADGRYLSTEVTGGFTGHIMGMYAIDGVAAFDWADYEDP